jgi:hypothetical protein
VPTVDACEHSLNVVDKTEHSYLSEFNTELSRCFVIKPHNWPALLCVIRVGVRTNCTARFQSRINKTFSQLFDRGRGSDSRNVVMGDRLARCNGSPPSTSPSGL